MIVSAEGGKRMMQRRIDLMTRHLSDDSHEFIRANLHIYSSGRMPQLSTPEGGRRPRPHTTGAPCSGRCTRSCDAGPT
jgi:hypothetical protein